MARVSIIVPIYNVERYIERCVRHLFEQTLDDIEYIFIDDCTPDKSSVILCRLINEYRQRLNSEHKIVKIFRMQSNSGQAAVRKKGLELATGDYILHCDSDDYFQNDTALKLWRKAVENKLDMVICDYYYVTKEGKDYFLGVKANNSEEIFYSVLTSFTTWALWNKLFKRELIEKYPIVFPDEGKNVGEDMLLSVQLVYYSTTKGAIGYINEPLYNYCANPESITNQKSVERIIHNNLVWVENIKKLLSFLDKRLSSDRFRDSELFLKYLPKKALSPYIKETEYALDWFNIFRDSNIKILSCSIIPKKEKLKYLYSLLFSYYKYIISR